MLPAAAVALCGVMAALLAVSSWISVPFAPVPFTLQTLAVLVTGGLLGRLWGPVSVLVYLLIGLVGVPVFAGFQGGPGTLFGPLGGFLFGFVLAAFIMGSATDLARRRGLRAKSSLVILCLGAAAAALAIYLPGLPWLMASTGLPLSKALSAAFFPFLIPDALKVVAAVGLIRAVDAALGQQGLRRF